MRSITIDILNDKALKLLQALEGLDLIKLRVEKKTDAQKPTTWDKYKGAMTKQPLAEIENQLADLRGEWE